MVLGVDRAASDVVTVTLDAPAVATAAQPGQFVTLRFPDVPDPFLPRPISIHAIDGGAVRLLVRVVGRMTRRLAGLASGARLHLVGPLGTGFRPPAGPVRHVVVAGGMGVAPFPLLLKRLGEMKEARVRVLAGARTVAGLYALDRLAPDRQTTITEDGRGERRGMVTDLLEEALQADEMPKAVYACGPEAMLAAVARLCIAAGVPCQVSLEAMMACGTGLCHGCVVRLARGGYARVCREGPVFRASDLAIPWSR